jgi:Asp-tRNA(Asn)/Glu-tRNA(Gln) amidotransferase B subunit
MAIKMGAFNPKQVEQVCAKAKTFGRFVGQVMRNGRQGEPRRGERDPTG